MGSEKLVNGKYYPLWQQFVDKKHLWIGGTLCCQEGTPTTITDVFLEPNGDNSATFGFKGTSYNCSFDVNYGGLCNRTEGPKECISFWLAFGGGFYVAANSEIQFTQTLE